MPFLCKRAVRHQRRQQRTPRRRSRETPLSLASGFHFSLSRDHTFTVWSLEALARRLPSGLKQTLLRILPLEASRHPCNNRSTTRSHPVKVAAMSRFIVALVLVSVPTAIALAGDEEWIDQRVFPRSNDTPLLDRDGKVLMKWSATAGKVTGVEKDRMIIRLRQYPGPYEFYVKKAEVVKLSDALSSSATRSRRTRRTRGRCRDAEKSGL